MKIIPIAQIDVPLRNYLQQAEGEPIVITENGKPVAVMTLIVDPDELERFLLARNPKFMKLIEEADRQIAETGGINHADFWKLVDDSYSQESQK
ncbi:MAG: type II toxin-antitoxin system Phd/YefM family antitoxin [Oscillatoriaceae cyanobacterium Prado104]|jgi:PHD/YefM family antitoxin component YafN of YafNO toxin-antitoxin module|nr:type II toxin-antitoxin system Phd/YefM family antitoxin [Oscillatoriaceae cyanobacterium Prado104]